MVEAEKQFRELLGRYRELGMSSDRTVLSTMTNLASIIRARVTAVTDLNPLRGATSRRASAGGKGAGAPARDSSRRVTLQWIIHGKRRAPPAH